MYRLAELKRLAEVYLEATGVTANLLSNDISGGSNNRMIGRLFEGKGMTGESVEAASDFFDRNWPAWVAWPEDVPPNGRRLGKPKEVSATD